MNRTKIPSRVRKRGVTDGHQRLLARVNSCSDARIAARASIASWAAWPDAGGMPSSWSANWVRVMDAASAVVLPQASSVSADPHAIVGTQPLAWNFIAEILPSAIDAVSFRMSPHAGFSSCTEAWGLGRTPALRGCSKWSSSFAEYTGILYDCSLSRVCGVPARLGPCAKLDSQGVILVP
jgi:hypothetical protein